MMNKVELRCLVKSDCKRVEWKSKLLLLVNKKIEKPDSAGASRVRGSKRDFWLSVVLGLSPFRHGLMVVNRVANHRAQVLSRSDWSKFTRRLRQFNPSSIRPVKIIG